MIDGWSSSPGLWIALLLPGFLYWQGVRTLHRRARPWNGWRSASYAGGLLAIAAALVSPIAAHDERFAIHLVQHLLLGMLAPVLLSLSAPVSLALRTLPHRQRQLLLRVLNSRVVAVVAHPITATVLFVGGLFALYATPLYADTLRHPLVHDLVHLHFLLSGCLFAWVFIGLDPVPRRGSFPLRVGLLVAALGSHAALAKLLYAGRAAASSSGGGTAELHLGSQIMFYAGDVIEGLLLVVFFAQWYARSGRELRREQYVVDADSRQPAAAQPPSSLSQERDRDAAGSDAVSTA